MLLFSVTILSSNRVTKLFRRKNEAILSNKLHANHLTILLIIVVIVGFRYNVGTDWLNYKSYYETQSGLDLYNYKQEYGFAFLMQLFQYYNISYSGFLIITALVPWVLILKAHYTKYLPLILFYLFTDGHLFISMNALRQFISVGIFVYSIKFIINRKQLYYILTIIVASQFHTSALILISIYYLPYDRLENNKIWIILYLISFIYFLSPSIFDLLQSMVYYLITKIAILSHYRSYIELGRYNIQGIGGTGLGVIYRVIVTCIIMYYHKDIVNKYPNSKYYLIIMYIGAIIVNLFFSIQLIQRVNYYLLIIRPIALAYLYFTLHNSKNVFKKLIQTGLIFCYILLFAVEIYNSVAMCSPYNFAFTR
jgi:hypothetical protein